MDGTVKVDSEPEQKANTPTAEPNTHNHEDPSQDNTVTLGDKGDEQEDGEVQVTDGDGNVVK